jgi:glycosyltransferase involved in cell wall biosynthesis
MSADPLVSVLISVYNAGEYLRPAVQSILYQTYRHLEILIIDDGSTDGCMDAIGDLNDPRIRRFSQDNQGKSVALNRALDEMRGEFYAIQDADDLSHPTRIERQLRCMQENPDVAAVFCGHELILNGRHVAPRFRAKDREPCRRDIEQMRMPAHDPTAMYRVSLVREVRYEPGLRVGQGYDYILRVGERHLMLVLGECLYSYRAHEGSATRASIERRRAAVREVVERACARRGIDVPAVNPDGAGRNAERDNNLVAHFIESALDLRDAGRPVGAVATAVECALLHPLDPHYHKAWVLAVAPTILQGFLRRTAQN